MSEVTLKMAWLLLADYDDALIPQLFANRTSAMETARHLIRYMLADNARLMNTALADLAKLPDEGGQIDIKDINGSYISIVQHSIQLEPSLLPK